MAALLTAFALLAFFLAYRFYARYLGEKIYGDHEEIQTPAHLFEDGQDFVPTAKKVLFGHHFTSIAGAAPILGPCVAAYWGWLPALAWIVLGTITMGAVHDFGALVLSVREKGRSIPDIAGKVVHPRVRLLFLCLVLVLSWLVLAVFAMAIAGMFVAVPSSVVPVNVEIVVALVMGWLLYRKKVPPFWPSLVALLLLYVLVALGDQWPVDFQALWGWSAEQSRDRWIVAMLLYAGVASMLPVWRLMQPRDYINSHQLVVGLALLFGGIFWAAPPMDAPAIRSATDGAPPIFPVLFVTIACGAISGFHGLVASGTSSKQLSSLRDARLVGYASMLGEGTLAVASTMAAVAGIALVGACELPAQGAIEDLSWASYYDAWNHAAANKSVAFVFGGAAFLESLGIPQGIARTLMAVMVISFAATTLDTATRIARMICAELGEAVGVKVLARRDLSTLVAIVPALAMSTWEVSDPHSGVVRKAGWILWPIFGASNQMIAALILMILAIYFRRRGKPVGALIYPMLFVMVITIFALFVSLRAFWTQGNNLLFSLSLLLAVLMLWMLVEGVAAARKTGVWSAENR